MSLWKESTDSELRRAFLHIRNWLDTASVGARITRSILLLLRAISIASVTKKEVLFVVGIDTEQDVDKNYIHTGGYRNIREGIPRLLDIFDDFKTKATWLITPDVARHCGNFFVELAKKHDVGCHVHPEYFEGSIKGTKMEKILPQFSFQNQLRMLQDASNEIWQNVGVRPKSFRAGRFAVNLDTFRALGSCGFNIDCSITPFLEWGFHETLTSSESNPYLINVGSGDLLEIPITIVRPFGLFPAWLRPSAYSGSDMINIMKIRAESREDPLVFNMMFHSMELIDPNPKFASKDFFNNVRCILEYAHKHDVSFVTMNYLHNRLRLSTSLHRSITEEKPKGIA